MKSFYEQELLLLQEYGSILDDKNITESVRNEYTAKYNELFETLVYQKENGPDSKHVTAIIAQEKQEYDSVSERDKEDKLVSARAFFKTKYNQSKWPKETREVAPLIERLYEKDGLNILSQTDFGCQDFLLKFSSSIRHSPKIYEKFQNNKQSLTDEDLKQIGYVSTLYEKISRRPDWKERFSKITGEDKVVLEDGTLDYALAEKFSNIATVYIDEFLKEYRASAVGKETFQREMIALNNVNVDELMERLIEISEEQREPKVSEEQRKPKSPKIDDAEIVGYIDYNGIIIEVGSNVEVIQAAESFDFAAQNAVYISEDLDSSYSDFEITSYDQLNSSRMIDLHSAMLINNEDLNEANVNHVKDESDLEYKEILENDDETRLTVASQGGSIFDRIKRASRKIMDNARKIFGRKNKKPESLLVEDNVETPVTLRRTIDDYRLENFNGMIPPIQNPEQINENHNLGQHYSSEKEDPDGSR